MRRLIWSRLIWIFTVFKYMSEFSQCPKSSDFTLMISKIQGNQTTIEPALEVLVLLALWSDKGTDRPGLIGRLARAFAAHIHKV